MIGVYIIHELSYDKFNANANRIVRATMEYRQAGTVNMLPQQEQKLARSLKELFL